MLLFPARAEEENRLQKCVAELLGKSRPDLVWVDNLSQNHRFWGIYPLFMEGGFLTRNVILPLGDYRLILSEGSRLSFTGAHQESSCAG